jgi:hypothetical protein
MQITPVAAVHRARLSQARKLVGGLALLLYAALAVAQTAGEYACANNVQGRVAWNRQGTTAWSPANVQNLCRGSTDPAATIACFEAGIRQHGDWQRATADCKAKPQGEIQSAPAPDAVAAAPAPADGRNVVAVTAAQGGQRVAEYRRSGGAGRWVELSPTGVLLFRFQETQRDDWSVYLVDPSRGVNLQLDLHTRKVMYSDAGSPRRELYDIVAASAPANAAPPAQAPLPPVADFAAAPPAAQPAPAAVYAPAPAAVYAPAPAAVYAPPPAAAAIPAPAPARVQAAALPAVNGRTATQVAFALQGRRLGDYRVSGQRRWVEVDSNGRGSFNFEETGRDDWSVYLADRSRGVEVQLDLHTRKVMVGDGRSARRVLYDIADASAGSVMAAQPASPAAAPPAAPVAVQPPAPAPAPVAVNGRTVRKVQFGQGGAPKGAYVQAGPGRWAETDASGRARFAFEETGRDDWSVYLTDRARGVSLQIDLHTRKVMYRDGNKPMQALYEVLGASASP